MKGKEAKGSSGSSMIPAKQKMGGTTITNKGAKGGEVMGELIGAKKLSHP